MRILLTGATGYIGKRILPVLVRQGHEVIACVRDSDRLHVQQDLREKIAVVEVDFLEPETLKEIPSNIDAAYFLIHSMGTSTGDFADLEAKAAKNFVDALNKTSAQQIIYLGGIANAPDLSKHLQSRLTVEQILGKGTTPVTSFRAGIIVGSGSASFEIIRDLTEKLPVMITPRWVRTRSRPIAIRNVVEYLVRSLGHAGMIGKTYDIGGPDTLTYKDMLMQYAEVRNLRRYILTVPLLTPRLSSYWLFFVTSTNFKLAANLVDSMTVEVLPEENRAADILEIDLIPYRYAVRMAFRQIQGDSVLSSWKDAYSSSNAHLEIDEVTEVPVHGCFKDRRVVTYNGDLKVLLDHIWAIGGDTGWYYANILWSIRGLIDKIVGGVGLHRGRTRRETIKSGDALDFWRVIIADRQARRLLLFAEMKLPGEAWLEFRVEDARDSSYRLIQEATFRPKGIWGRVYWYILHPIHHFVFGGLIRSIKSKALSRMTH